MRNLLFYVSGKRPWYDVESMNRWLPRAIVSVTCDISVLTHWGRVTHKYVVKLAIIGSDNSLSPGRRKAIVWTNDGILITGPLGTNFIEILIEIYTFSFKKMHLKMSSGKCHSFCLGLNVLRNDANVDGLMQDCSSSSALAMEIMPMLSCTDVFLK